MTDKRSSQEPVNKNMNQTASSDSFNEAIANLSTKKEIEAIPDNVKVASPNRKSILWFWRGHSKNSNGIRVEHDENSTETSTIEINPISKRAVETNSLQLSDKEKENFVQNERAIAVDSSSEQQQQIVKDEPAETLSSFQAGRIRNVVLPTFSSQFSCRFPQKEEAQASSYVGRLLETFSAFFTQKPQEQPPNTSLPLIETIVKKADSFGDKNIVVIGVHGWFPLKLVRSMVGEPTGTSEKFCQEMEVAVRRYFELEHDIIIPKASIKSIPLRWEGKVMERVDKFYEQITSSSEHHGDSDGDNSWKDAIKNADIVLWATHSQGAPVSALLIKRLLSEGILQTQKQHICMLAMAGISHGPFPSLKDHLFVKYFEADAARELFEFMDSECTISIQYRDSMVFLLQEQVKVVFVGSMDDQVVPLYSAIMSGISHPNILRAIFIDGQLYSENDFLIRLITFAIRLLNAGLSDHGFLTHISEVLAGNFYAWNGGHSTLYEETDVFMLPMDFLFKTSPLGPFRIKSVVQQLQEKTFQGVKARLNPFQAKHNLNPFYLPWTLRGIWDDPQILENEELNRELKSIQSLFEQWSPTTARLKGIKFRLEPLRARL